MAGRGRQSTLPAWLTETAKSDGPKLPIADGDGPSAADRFADAAFAAVGRPMEEDMHRDRARTGDARGEDRDRDVSRHKSR